MSNKGEAAAQLWPAGDGGMAVRVREFDWRATSLGPIEAWAGSLRALVDFVLSSALPSAVVCGPDQLLLYNDGCARLQGDRHPRAFGRSALGTFPEAFSDAGDIHRRLLAGETLSFFDRPWVFQRQGALVTARYDAHFTPVRDEGGGFAYVHALILNAGLTAAVVPSVLPSSLRKMPSPDILWVLDNESMQLDYASPALENLVGRARDGIVHDFRRWLALVHPTDRPALDAHLRQAAAGEAVVTDYQITTPGGGEVVDIRQTSFPIRGANASAGRTAGIVQDITALRQASAELGEETERLRQLVDGMPHLVWRSSNEGLWTWASSQWLEYTGQTQEQSHAWGWLDAVHPDDREATMHDWHLAQPHGVLDTCYRVRRASDKAWRWHQTRSLPRRASSRLGEPPGPIIEWIGTSTDIHELKQLQMEQQSLLEQLERRAGSLATVAQSIGD